MKSKAQKNFACDPSFIPAGRSVTAPPAEISDDSAVRLGDGGIYFAPPAEIADDGAVRIGDGGIYF